MIHSPHWFPKIAVQSTQIYTNLVDVMDINVCVYACDANILTTQLNAFNALYLNVFCFYWRIDGNRM